MKTIIFLTLLVSLFTSCGQQAVTHIEVSASYISGASSLADGMMVYAQNERLNLKEARFARPGELVSFDLPNGEGWNFAAFGYRDQFGSDVVCDVTKNVALNGSEVDIDLYLSANNCIKYDSELFNSEHVSPGTAMTSVDPTKLKICGDGQCVASVTSQSVKVNFNQVPLQDLFTNNDVKPGLSKCYPITYDGSSSYYAEFGKLPNTSYELFPLMNSLELYSSSDCSGTPDGKHLFPFGFGNKENRDSSFFEHDNTSNTYYLYLFPNQEDKDMYLQYYHNP